MDTLKSTLLHTLELIVVIAAAFAITKLLGVDSESTVAIGTVVLGSFAKFARASEHVPVDDYVNK